MFSKTKKNERIDSDQREQYEYARQRVKQKKGLMRHFIVFLVGSILFIIINPVLGYGDDFFIKNWFVWAILLWSFLLLIHVFNVFVMNTFMGKEWEHQQLEKLKAHQEKRIEELKKQALHEVTIKEVRAARAKEGNNIDPQEFPVKKNAPNQLPPEQT